MSSRLYTATIILFWVASMTWLVADRILPPFLATRPPAEAPSRQYEPIAWRIEMGKRTCGVAVSQSERESHGVHDVHSVVRIDSFRTPDKAPFWIAPALEPLRGVSVKIKSLMTYDALETLSTFSTIVYVDQINTPVRLRGRVVNGNLELTARVGEITQRFKHRWLDEQAVRGELMPAPRLEGLTLGQRWTQEVFSPLASPRQPMELVEAEVAEVVRIPYGEEESVDVWRVEYRSIDKTGSTEERRLRAVSFVARDGQVLRQEAHLLGSEIAFTRLPPEESAEIAAELLTIETPETPGMKTSWSAPKASQKLTADD